MDRSRTVPAGMDLEATRLFVKTRRSGTIDSAARSLSTGAARIRSIQRIPSTRVASSPVVTEATTSGPNISRDRVTWTSRTWMPSVAAASPGKIVPEWSERPTAQE